jgi:hypothetical protein
VPKGDGALLIARGAVCQCLLRASDSAVVKVQQSSRISLSCELALLTLCIVSRASPSDDWKHSIVF